MANKYSISRTVYERAQALVEEAIELLREEQERLQEIYDEKSERWQEGETGEAVQERIGIVEQAADDLENIDWSTGE